MQLWACKQAPTCTATAQTMRAHEAPEHLCGVAADVVPFVLVDGELEPSDDGAESDDTVSLEK